MSNTLKDKDIKDIITKVIGHRKRFKILGWNEGPKEKNVVRYKNELETGDHIISAKVIHLWAFLEHDNSFGIFPEVLAEVVCNSLSCLIVIFKRPRSRICIIYRLGRTDMGRSRDSWGYGQDDQIQIPIQFFTKLDEIEWP